MCGTWKALFRITLLLLSIQRVCWRLAVYYLQLCLENTCISIYQSIYCRYINVRFSEEVFDRLELTDSVLYLSFPIKVVIGRKGKRIFILKTEAWKETVTHFYVPICFKSFSIFLWQTHKCTFFFAFSVYKNLLATFGVDLCSRTLTSRNFEGLPFWCCHHQDVT